MSEIGTEVDRQIGARIQRERERVGLSRAELAAAIQISEAGLKTVELGHSRAEPEVLLDVANRLGLPLSDLLKPPQI